MVEEKKELTFKVTNFTYNGFMGQKLPGEAPYTATFVEWTNDPGVARCKCSDGKVRLIPTFAFEGDRSGLPEQSMENKVYFGATSQEEDAVMELKRAPGTCCPEPGCDYDNRAFWELENPKTCPQCGADCSQCELKRKGEIPGIAVEHRKEGSGLRVRGTFIPFLKEGDSIDSIICVPKGENPLEDAGIVVPGSQTGQCDRCGCDIWLAPSSQEIMKQYPNAPTRCLYCVTKELEEEQKKKEEK